MRHLSHIVVAATAVLVVVAPRAASAQASHAAHVAQAGDPVQSWGPAPAVFPAGAKFAVLQGDPSKPEAFTVRLRFPAGYRIAPHTHPTDEHVTVIAGSLRVGMGNSFDASAMKALPTGGFVTAPANMAHYVEAVGETIVQVHATGPFVLTYVNPADTPKAAQK